MDVSYTIDRDKNRYIDNYYYYRDDHNNEEPNKNFNFNKDLFCYNYEYKYENYLKNEYINSNNLNCKKFCYFNAVIYCNYIINSIDIDKININELNSYIQNPNDKLTKNEYYNVCHKKNLLDIFNFLNTNLNTKNIFIKKIILYIFKYNLYYGHFITISNDMLDALDYYNNVNDRLNNVMWRTIRDTLTSGVNEIKIYLINIFNDNVLKFLLIYLPLIME